MSKLSETDGAADWFFTRERINNKLNARISVDFSLVNVRKKEKFI